METKNLEEQEVVKDVENLDSSENVVDNEEVNQDNEEVKEEKKKDKKKYLLLLLLLLLLLFTITVVSFVFIRGNKIDDIVNNGLSIGIDSNLSDGNGGKSKEELQAELNKKVEEGMMNVSMNTNIVLKNGKSKANLKITNKENNRYMQFVEIYTKEDNKLIHKTGGIPVGKSLNEAKLDEELKKGTYECVAYFNGVDETTNSIVGKVGVNITINVLN